MVIENSFLLDPIAAVIHPDPYPFYAGLVAERPLYRDDALGLWVAASIRVFPFIDESDLVLRACADSGWASAWVAA